MGVEKGHKTNWPPLMETVSRGCSDGLSASQIAALIWTEHHVAVTRNAVIGAVHRSKENLQLKAKPHSSSTPKRPRRTGVNPQRIRRARAQAYDPAAPRRRDQPRLVSAKRDERPPAPEPVEAVQVGLNIPMADLQDGQCSWPTAEGPTTYCGHPTPSKRHSYCPWHDSVVHGRPGREAAPLKQRNRYA